MSVRVYESIRVCSLGRSNFRVCIEISMAGKQQGTYKERTDSRLSRTPLPALPYHLAIVLYPPSIIWVYPSVWLEVGKLRERALAPTMGHKLILALKASLFLKSRASIKVWCKWKIFCISLSDSEMQMAMHDTVLVVITGGIIVKFKDLGSEILKNGGLPNIHVQYKTSKSTYLYQRRQVEHSCTPSKDGGYNRQGIGDRPWMSKIGTWSCR